MIAPNLPRWFTEEVQPHERQLRAYLRRTFPSVRDVDDVVQESYLRIWRKQAARPLGSARAFLFRVARNFAVDPLGHLLAARDVDEHHELDRLIRVPGAQAPR